MVAASISRWLLHRLNFTVAKASVKSFCPCRVLSYGHLRSSAKILADHAHKKAELFRICDAQVITPKLHFLLTRNATTPGKHHFSFYSSACAPIIVKKK